MMRHPVVRTIDSRYRRRLPDYDGTCKHLHGHGGRLEIEVASGRLDARGMVVDFGQVRLWEAPGAFASRRADPAPSAA